VLPRALLGDDTTTAVYPAGVLLGDLVVVHGTDVRTVSPGEGALRIGRGPHNDLVLDRPGVGRDHLVIEARGDAWWIVPGTSPGGTKVDGAALDTPTPVRSGTTLELGRGVRLRLNVEPA
jgi:pSer/pThr/pTyr-binding forkhead associated (FHA) protein